MIQDNSKINSSNNEDIECGYRVCTNKSFTKTLKHCSNFGLKVLSTQDNPNVNSLI